jgi:hypothetical protein
MDGGIMNRLRNKSFLLLFFKKEALASSRRHT